MDDEFARLTEKDETKSLDTILETYVTNDDVGGGLPKIVDLFFHESKATEFIDMEDIAMKREYFDLF